jgi:hypothetical protein
VDLNTRAHLIAEIAGLQEPAAPVTIQIGATVNSVVRPGMVRILDAPQTVVAGVIRWIEENNMKPDSSRLTYTVTGGALLIS